jgi:shikimate dehydrogenase
LTISGRARLGGIIGDPVAHSLSPRLHAHWLAAHGIDGAYVPLHVAREAFSTAVTGLQAAGFAGVNVTVPHKEAAFAIAGQLDAAALDAGAVNLLLFRPEGIEGRNTDSPGLANSLVDVLGMTALRGRSVAILGAGGAARAAVHACGALGVADIRVIARSAARAEARDAARPRRFNPMPGRTGRRLRATLPS